VALVLAWVVVAAAGACVLAGAGARGAGPGSGHGEVPRRRWWLARRGPGAGVPVFSLYVVQAGSARPLLCGPGLPGSVQPSWW